MAKLMPRQSDLECETIERRRVGDVIARMCQLELERHTKLKQPQRELARLLERWNSIDRSYEHEETPAA